jgi:hypothetical protein
MKPVISEAAFESFYRIKVAKQNLIGENSVSIIHAIQFFADKQIVLINELGRKI